MRDGLEDGEWYGDDAMSEALSLEEYAERYMRDIEADITRYAWRHPPFRTDMMVREARHGVGRVLGLWWNETTLEWFASVLFPSGTKTCRCHEMVRNTVPLIEGVIEGGRREG